MMTHWKSCCLTLFIVVAADVDVALLSICSMFNVAVVVVFLLLLENSGYFKL